MISFFSYNLIVIAFYLNNQQTPFSVTHDVIKHNEVFSDGMPAIEKKINNRIDDSSSSEHSKNKGKLSVQEVMERMSGVRIDDKDVYNGKDNSQAQTTPKLDSREEGTYINIYERGVFLKRSGRFDVVIPDYSRFDITVVTVGSHNRFFVFPIFAKRWNGPIVFSIHLLEDQLPSFEEFIQKEENSILRESRIRFVTYICKKGSFFSENYPINILRNLGIYNVKTSHFMVLDMDMWLSDQSYETLLALPDDIKSSTRTAVVIPAFFHTGWSIFNGTLEQQVNRIPFTMTDLLECVKKGKCSQQKKNLFTHRYVPQQWIIDKNKGVFKDYYNYTCWRDYLQEPYLLVYRNDSITLFNERFINYGFNKISYVETLRREEYRFVLAGKVYAFDLPHLPSKYQKSHATHTKSGNYLTNYYYTQNLIARTKHNKNILKFCKN